MDLEEQKRRRKFLLAHEEFLKNFLTPLDLLDKMPCFGKETQAHTRIYQEHLSPNKQVDIFLEELQQCNEPGTLQSFLDALRNTPDQEWIFKLVSGDIPDQEIEKWFYHVQNIDRIKQVLAIIKPQLKGIMVEDLLEDMARYISPREKETLQAQCRAAGNTIGLFWIFQFLERKNPKWLKTLFQHVKRRGYGDGDSARTTLANALNEYFDFGSDSAEEEMEIESNNEIPTAFHTHAENKRKINSSPNLKEQMDAENYSDVATTSRTYTESTKEVDNEDAPMKLNIPLPTEEVPKLKQFGKFSDEVIIDHSQPERKPIPTNEGFKTGDRVRIGSTLKEADLNLLQEGHGGWNSTMSQLIGKPGFVHRMLDNGDVRVQYEKRLLRGMKYSKPIWTFHPAALELIS